jgi:tetratricopeptide (TPR) repeat protein
LRRGAALYDRGRLAEAREIFGRYRSLEARVGAALARWPDRTVDELRRLAREHPRRAVARLHLGLGLFWTGQREEALAEWRAAIRVEPDSLSAVRADDLVHPNFPRGLPSFVPSFAAPAAVVELPPARQLDLLARRARTGGWREQLLYGVALQRVGRPISARRAYDSAAAAAPAELEPRIAAAVARFEKAHPEQAFARLGPLSRRHPRSPSVRFHLGLLLLWLGQVDEGKRQLLLARAADPAGPLGREAARFLSELGEPREN